MNKKAEILLSKYVFCSKHQANRVMLQQNNIVIVFFFSNLFIYFSNTLKRGLSGYPAIHAAPFFHVNQLKEFTFLS